MNKVQVWEEKVIIPTYEAGKPDIILTSHKHA